VICLLPSHHNHQLGKRNGIRHVIDHPAVFHRNPDGLNI
jgi:hypothetical protein